MMLIVIAWMGVISGKVFSGRRKMWFVKYKNFERQILMMFNLLRAALSTQVTWMFYFVACQKWKSKTFNFEITFDFMYPLYKNEIQNQTKLLHKLMLNFYVSTSNSGIKIRIKIRKK